MTVRTDIISKSNYLLSCQQSAVSDRDREMSISKLRNASFACIPWKARSTCSRYLEVYWSISDIFQHVHCPEPNDSTIWLKNQNDNDKVAGGRPVACCYTTTTTTTTSKILLILLILLILPLLLPIAQVTVKIPRLLNAIQT